MPATRPWFSGKRGLINISRIGRHQAGGTGSGPKNIRSILSLPITRPSWALLNSKRSRSTATLDLPRGRPHDPLPPLILSWPPTGPPP